MLQCPDNHTDCCKTDWQNLHWHKVACWDKVVRKHNQFDKTVCQVWYCRWPHTISLWQTRKHTKIQKNYLVYLYTIMCFSSTVTTMSMKSSNKLTCLYYISTITKLHKKSNLFRFVDSVWCVPWVSSCFLCVCALSE